MTPLFPPIETCLRLVSSRTLVSVWIGLCNLIVCIAVSILSALTVRAYVSPGKPLSFNLFRLNELPVTLITECHSVSTFFTVQLSSFVQINSPLLLTVIVISVCSL